jgi:hypothetical protein
MKDVKLSFEATAVFKDATKFEDGKTKDLSANELNELLKDYLVAGASPVIDLATNSISFPVAGILELD